MSYSRWGGGDRESQITQHLNEYTAPNLARMVVNYQDALHRLARGKLGDTARSFLTFALDEAEKHMYSYPDEFGPGDWEALEELRHLAAPEGAP